jgi:hypothetical protein
MIKDKGGKTRESMLATEVKVVTTLVNMVDVNGIT